MVIWGGHVLVKPRPHTRKTPVLNQDWFRADKDARAVCEPVSYDEAGILFCTLL